MPRRRAILSSARPQVDTRLAALLTAMVFTAFVYSSQATAQGVDKPYDDRLLRLSEILGAVHYLRELCGANEGQVWRERMNELIEAEGSSAMRRARLTRSFNQGYYGYSKTHKICTTTAQTAISRFMSEGVQLSDGLLKSIP